MTPYEAAAAATTLFAIGARWGADLETHNESDGATVHGFQQCPLDHLFGDAAFGLHGRHLLLEFKRAKEEISSEAKKPLRAALLQRLAQPDEASSAMRTLADGAHVLAYSRKRDNSFELCYGRYTLLIGSLSGSVIRDEQFVMMTTFIDGILGSRAPKPGANQNLARAILVLGNSVVADANPVPSGISFDDFLKYLECVLDPNGAEETSEPPPAVSDLAGYWISVSPTAGLACACYTSLEELRILRQAAIAANEQDPPSITAGPAPRVPKGPRMSGR